MKQLNYRSVEKLRGADTTAVEYDYHFYASTPHKDYMIGHAMTRWKKGLLHRSAFLRILRTGNITGGFYSPYELTENNRFEFFIDMFQKEFFDNEAVPPGNPCSVKIFLLNSPKQGVFSRDDIDELVTLADLSTEHQRRI